MIHYVIPALLIALLIWAYGDNIFGFGIRTLVRVFGSRGTLKIPRTTIELHTQDDSIIGTAWGIEWRAGNRRHHIHRDYMGWHDMSEGHTRDKCDDPAYCPWHGSL